MTPRPHGGRRAGPQCLIRSSHCHGVPTEASYGEPMRALRRTYVVTSLIFLTVFEAWLRLELGGAFATRAFVDISSTVIPLTAGVLAIMRAQVLPKERRIAWHLLGLASISWGLGGVAWAYYELVARVEAPFPSLADVGYLGLIPFGIGALLVMVVGSTQVASRLRTLLDGLIIVLALLFLAMGTFAGPIVDYARANYSTFEQAVLLAYPLGDLILLSLLLLVASRVTAGVQRTFMVIAAGLVCLMVADVGYWYLSAQGTYSTGVWTDIGWVAGFSLLGYAALRPIPRVENEGDFRPGFLLAWLPLAPFMAATIASMWIQIRDGALNPFLYWNAVAVVSVLAVRQTVMLWENLSLRKQIEAALVEVEGARDRLEERVQERTLDLEKANAGLADEAARRAKAQQEAERASNAKSLFLATMSHEIRTPLNAVIGLASVLQDQKLNPEQRTQMETIRQSSEQLLRVLNDILDYTKMESGELALENHPVDPKTIAAGVIEAVRPRATAKGLELVLDVDPSIPVLESDAGRIQQVMLNYLDNAVKFTEEGRIRLGLSAQVSERTCLLQIEVEDTGRGLSDEESARLFQPFQQGDASLTRSTGGTGLGLAICRRLAELMGGRTWVESSPGKGSHFFATVAAQLADKAVATPEVASKAPLRKLKILLAEDNLVNQKVAVAMLKRLDQEVTVVGDGLAAVAAAKDARFDVILMDIQMPNMDGMAATDAIRGLGASKDAHIVAMTAHAMPDDRQRFLDSGMNDYLPKPVRLEDLRATLARV